MRNLQAALKEVNRKPIGIDAIPWEAYRNPLTCLHQFPRLLDAFPELDPMKSLQENMAYGCNPDAVEPFRIGKRIVERGTVGNRIIERAISRKLSAFFDHILNDASYGFRPRMSAEIAILRVRAAIRKGAYWALKTDIEGFFGGVDREELKLLLQLIPDTPLFEAILAAVSPVVVCNGNSYYRQNGLPQGNGITPFLSNLYLHPLDEGCSKLRYYRYVDDILVLGCSRDEVEQARGHIRRFVATLGLRLAQEKTRIRDLYCQPIVFLGYELRGGNVWPPQQAIEQFEEKLLSRGQEDREQLMKGFVRRFSIGPVRKLFRRLDRRFADLFPLGVSLVGLLDAVRAGSVVSKTEEEAVTV